MKEFTLNAALLIPITFLIISTKDGSSFYLVQGGPVAAKWTQAGPSGEELTMHIKDGYINRIINVIAVPIMNRDGSVDKVTLGNGWLWFASQQEKRHFSSYQDAEGMNPWNSFEPLLNTAKSSNSTEI